MKKAITFLLSVSLVFSMTACGGKDSEAILLQKSGKLVDRGTVEAASYTFSEQRAKGCCACRGRAGSFRLVCLAEGAPWDIFSCSPALAGSTCAGVSGIYRCGQIFALSALFLGGTIRESEIY